MPHRPLTSGELADDLHRVTGDVERLLRETDLPHPVRSARTVVPCGEIDAEGLPPDSRPAGRLDAWPEKSAPGTRTIVPGGALIPGPMRRADIDLARHARTRAAPAYAALDNAERAVLPPLPGEKLTPAHGRGNCPGGDDRPPHEAAPRGRTLYPLAPAP